MPGEDVSSHQADDSLIGIEGKRVPGQENSFEGDGEQAARDQDADERHPGAVRLGRLDGHRYNPPVRLNRWIAPEVLIPLVAVLARVIPGPRVIDDAFITFRYARNVLSGNGLVYNPGEPVFGITTPLFVAVIVLLAITTGGAQAPFPWLALGVSATADAATCWLLIQIGEQLGHRRAGLLAALLWALSPMSVTFAIGGMETSLFILLLAATLYFHLNRQPTRAAGAASLAILARPDGALMALLLGAERLRSWLRKSPSSPSPSLREGAAFVVPLALWSVFAWAAYGSPIPHSILAKATAYHLPSEAALVRLLQHFSTPFMEQELVGTLWIGIGLVLYPALFVLGVRTALRNRPEVWPMAAYPWLYFAAFAIANPLIFRWYLAPPVPFYMLGIFLGVDRLALDLRRPTLAYAAAAFALVFTLGAWTPRADHGPPRPAPRMAFIRLELLYDQVGRWLEPRLEPHDVVAAGDIGVLGFTTDAPILDLVGLVSPASSAYYPLPDSDYIINFAISPDLVADLHPDYVVFLDSYGRRTLLQDARFLTDYTLIESFPTDLYSSQAMLVYRRQPGP